MFCTNCGSSMSDDAVFCTNCGNKFQKDEAVSDVATVTEEATTVATVAEETPAVEPASAEELEMAPVLEFEKEIPAPEKSRKGRNVPAIGIIVGVLLLVFGTGFLFRDAIFAALMPKLYLSNVVDNTFEEISKEGKEYSKWLYGFDVEKEPEVTYSIEGTIDEIPDVDIKPIGAEIKVAKSDKKKVLAMDSTIKYDGDDIVSALFALDNEEMAFDVPEFFKDPLTMPSKDFGKAWNDSEIGKESGIEFSDDLDLSYEALTENKDYLTEETLKAIKEETKALLDEATLEMSKGEADVDGKSVKTRRIDVAIPTDAFEDYAKNVFSLIGEDENVTKYWNDEMRDEWEYMEEEFEDGIKEFCDLCDDEFLFTLDVYKGKVVRFSYEAEIEDVDLLVTVEFRDSKNLINNIYAIIEITAEGETGTIEIESVGKHVPEGNVFTDETSLEVDFPYEDPVVFENTATIDMKKGVFEEELKVKVDGGKAALSLEGKCSNKKAFEMTIDEIKVSFDDGYGYSDSVKIKCDIKFSAIDKFDIELPDTSDGLNLLEADEDDLEKWAEGVEEKAAEFAEKHEADLEELGLGGSSYDDDYYYDDYYYDDYYYDDYYYDDYYYDDYYYDDYYYDDYYYDDYYYNY